MQWNFAAIWEVIAEVVPDAPALIEGKVRRTWRDYEARAARIAAGLLAAGLEPDAKVGFYAFNSAAYLESHFGALKARTVPVNVNYRYAEQELLYLLDNADAEALLFDAQFADRVAAIRDGLPKLKLLIEIDDGSGAHLDGAVRLEDLIKTHPAAARRSDYAEDDIYMMYTGGTTGMPKGVMYRQGDFSRFFLDGFAARGLPRPETRAELVAAVRAVEAAGLAPKGVPACPLMHPAAMVGAMGAHQLGGCVVVFRNEHFDPAALWDLVAREGVTDITIVGDAFARPMLKALEAAAADGRPFDVSSLKQIRSSGVMFSREVKTGLLAFADISIVDAMGATEGAMASTTTSRASPPGETAKFIANPGTKVFDEDDREILPGSDKIGRIANGGFTPVGYYKDPVKTAATFREIDGRRYSFPGDFAKIAADGALILLGRGSNCINTGGEKVFPEEVEEALKAHPDVEDCLVVGVPDERFGERVTAVLAATRGRTADPAALTQFVRSRIASYKAPREIVFVDEVRRGPNGKADYGWAKAFVRGGRAGPA